MKFSSVLAIASLTIVSAQSPADSASAAVGQNSTAFTGAQTQATSESAKSSSEFSGKRAHPKMRRTLGLTNRLLGPQYQYQQPPPPPQQGPTVFLPQQGPPQQQQQYAPPPPPQYAPPPQYGYQQQYGSGCQNLCQGLCRLCCPCTWFQGFNQLGQGLGFGQPYYGGYQQQPPPPSNQYGGGYVLVADDQNQNQEESKFDVNTNANSNSNSNDEAISILQNKVDQLTHQLEAHAGTACSRAHGPDGVANMFNAEDHPHNQFYA